MTDTCGELALVGIAALATLFVVQLGLMNADRNAAFRNHLDLVVVGGVAILLAIMGVCHPEWLM